MKATVKLNVLSLCSGALALALNNGNILILEAESSAVIRRLHGHSPPDGICEIAFFPDAKWMVSFGSTGTVKTWDLMDGKCVLFAVLGGHFCFV